MTPTPNQTQLGAKRYFFAAGGTGGGIYPALAIADALRQQAPASQLYYIGSAGGMEEHLVPRQQFAGYFGVQGGPLHGVSRLRQVASLAKLMLGIVQAWRGRPTEARSFVADRRLGHLCGGRGLLVASDTGLYLYARYRAGAND
jgi:hypothetical protein